jgi:hypothetical protein
MSCSFSMTACLDLDLVSRTAQAANAGGFAGSK